MARASGGRASSFPLNRTFDFVPSALQFDDRVLALGIHPAAGHRADRDHLEVLLVRRLREPRGREPGPPVAPIFASTRPCCAGFLPTTTLPLLDRAVERRRAGRHLAEATFGSSFAGRHLRRRRLRQRPRDWPAARPSPARRWRRRPAAVNVTVSPGLASHVRREHLELCHGPAAASSGFRGQVFDVPSCRC